MAIDLGLVLLVRRWLHDRGKQQALVNYRKLISRAIHQLVNKPQPTAPMASWDAFADTFRERVFEMLCGRGPNSRKRCILHRSDALHFQRLGVFPPVIITQHPAADHTVAMLTEKIKRLRDVIEWNRLTR